MNRASRIDLEVVYPGYIRRHEEQRIRECAAQVRADGQSRAVLLYGSGGIGKTTLVRGLSQGPATSGIIWLDAVDVDDSEYWLLSNLERHIATQLDPGSYYFQPYLDHLSTLPAQAGARVGYDTVVSHLGRIKRIFAECYQKYIEESGNTVVIAFDTVEAIRAMHFQLTLTQWIKALPGTLFILAGRPLADGEEDPFRRELADPHLPLPFTTVNLGAFPREDALRYLNESEITAGLPDDDKARIIHMTRGHPLWLALAISYLQTGDIPAEATAPRNSIEREVPLTGELSREGQVIYEAFKRRLVTPYRDTDFWHETVKRLAVVRQGVNKPIWQGLMADRPLPADAPDADVAWEMLLKIPWIRRRANGRFVTLHDALAEELAQRIIPAHDQDRTWRLRQWGNAVQVYSQEIERRQAIFRASLAESDQLYKEIEVRLQADGPAPAQRADQVSYIQDVVELDAEKRGIDQLKAASLSYLLLSDFAGGCRQFTELSSQADSENDVLFKELLALEMQRFLPAQSPYALADVVGQRIGEFGAWLRSDGAEAYLEIGTSLADHLVQTHHSHAALQLLDSLPLAGAPALKRYRISIIKGNALMRVPGKLRAAGDEFAAALTLAKDLSAAGEQSFVAEAYKEQGFYYRNVGMWVEADNAYQQARDQISATLAGSGSAEDREEMASIQTNWGYVKGLVGSYREGLSLAESAIAIRHRLGKPLEEGISWSVCGEVYRYERRFNKAWQAYAEAEQIFHAQKDWPWLGVLWQQQAICLFQALQDDVQLHPDQLTRARQLIVWALDVCDGRNVRAYPSALNRAGRIVGESDVDEALKHLAKGIEEAAELSDGWFLFANLIEYVELCYRTWAKSRESRYLDLIQARQPHLEQVMAEYAFPDLRGRWDLLRGHLEVHRWLETSEAGVLEKALDCYDKGFGQIAEGYVGSSGASALPGEFRSFREILGQLPEDVQVEWQATLRERWSRQGNSTLLLAFLEGL